MDIYGTAGDDQLERLHAPGIDIWVNVWGGAGNDTIRVNGSTAIGEAGNDTIVDVIDPAMPVVASVASAAYWNSPAGVTVDLAAGTAQDGFGTVDKLQNIRAVQDSAHDDHFTGSARNEQFWLSSGNDTVIGGGGGSDTVIFGNMRSTEVTITYDLASDTATVAKHTAAGDNGTVTLTGISGIQFAGSLSDSSIATIGSAADGKLLTGGNGTEIIQSGAGDDTISGGDGVDTVAYTGDRAGYTVINTGTGLGVSGAQGSDALSGIERLAFADRSTAFDIEGAAGQAYRMYQAVFDRDPDLAGMGFWLKMLDNGVSLAAVAQGFIDSAEFDALYGAAATSTEIVTRLYTHVFNRPDDTAGIGLWADAVDSGNMALADLVFGLAESDGNTVDLVGVTQDGVDYLPY